MAGKRSPRLPAQPKMVQKRTGSAGATKGDPPGRGKRVSEASKHSVKPGQQAPAKPTSGASAPFPQGPRDRSSAPTRAAASGIRDQASKGGSGSLFERMDARNRKLSQRNRPSA